MRTITGLRELARIALIFLFIGLFVGWASKDNILAFLSYQVYPNIPVALVLSPLGLFVLWAFWPREKKEEMMI